MNDKEVTSNIIVAMINNKFIATSEDISTAYKEIFKAVYNPLEK